jgi:hypothetical protein
MSQSQADIVNFIESNFQSLQQKHRKRTSGDSNSKKKRKKKEEDIVASKVLIIVGNTQLIREYVLNELKDEHNLNI